MWSRNTGGLGQKRIRLTAVLKTDFIGKERSLKEPVVLARGKVGLAVLVRHGQIMDII